MVLTSHIYGCHLFSLPLAKQPKSEEGEGGLQGLWGRAVAHLEAKQSSKSETQILS